MVATGTERQRDERVKTHNIGFRPETFLRFWSETYIFFNYIVTSDKT